MAGKQLGTCPFCKEQVRANVTVERRFRRDTCECPECGESILVCRMPGCGDYAKVRQTYDHEFCPECTKKLTIAGGFLLAAAATRAVENKVDQHMD